MTTTFKLALTASIAALATAGVIGVAASANGVFDEPSTDSSQVQQKEAAYEDPDTMADPFEYVDENLGVVTDEHGNRYEDPATMISPEELAEQLAAGNYEDPDTMAGPEEQVLEDPATMQ